MNYRKQRRVRGSIGWAVTLSVGFHLLLCVLFVLNVFNISKGEESTTPETKPPVKEEEFEVTAVFEDELEPEPEEVAEEEPEEVAELEPEPEPEPEIIEELPEPEPEEVAELEPEPEPEPEEEQEETEAAELPPVDLNKLAVVQETNDELPVDAAHISDQANKVDEEMVAEETSMEEVEKPEEENANPMADAMAPTEPAEEDDIKADDVMLETAMPQAPVVNEPVVPAPAMVVQSKAEQLKAERAEEAIEKLEEIVEVEEGIGEAEKLEPQEARDPKPAVAESEAPTPVQKPEKKFDPKSLFQADINDYEKVFGGTDNQLRERERVDPKARRLLKDWKDKEDVMRASIENFVQHVKPGNHTGVNASPAVYASYLARIHRRIHARYANDFIYHATHNIPGSHPLNRMDLNTLVEIVIDAKTGAIEQTNIIRSSGETLFDAETVLVSRSIGRHPNPPDEIVSKDGRVYVHWNFWRDSRQCGTFGAAIYLLNE